MAQVIHIHDPQTGSVHPCRVGQSVQVGRADPTSSPEIACKDPHVSRRHCEFHATDAGQVRIVDRSTYGTFINGQRIQGEGRANPNDRIVLGYSYALVVMPPRTASSHDTDSDKRTNIETATGPAATIPRMIGDRYQVVTEIGRGGMGVVYQATDNQLNQNCAIKVLFESTEFDRTERFKREARLAAKLGDYPAIVRVYDCGVLPPRSLYLVMDFVDGVSLAQLAKTGVDRLLGVKLVARTARAVDYAHQRGVVHRDLKPENVLVTKEYRIRLTDFGIAKEDGSGLTMTGVAMGTPNFMAPEQIEDSKRVGPPADVYGLGGILYCVLTKKAPFRGKRVGEILRKVQKGLLVPPKELVPNLEPFLNDICIKALSLHPADRHPSAADLSKELENWLKQHPSSASGAVHLDPPSSHDC